MGLSRVGLRKGIPSKYESDRIPITCQSDLPYVIKFAKQLKPSARGELEITDINNFYLEEKQLNIFKLSSIDAWFDAGNYDFLLETSQYIKSIENKKNLIYGCPYLSAFQLNNITKEKYLAKSTLYK